MTSLLAIDPGKKLCGWAFFAGWRRLELSACGLSAPDWVISELHDTFGGARLDDYGLIAELPRTYDGRARKGDANDLIAVAFAAGLVIGDSKQTKYVTVSPSDWKGNVPKPKRASDPYIIEERCRAILRPRELAVVPDLARSKAHNVWDAVGIGLWHLGRLHIGRWV